MSLACLEIEQLDEIACESTALGVDSSDPARPLSRSFTLEQREHLASCVSCRARLGELQANLQMQRSLRQLLGRGSHDGSSGGVATQADAESRVDPLPEIPGFEIVRQLGRGGMGVVYEARQLTPARRVALKVAREGDSRRFGRQIEHEAAALARLSHPNIATLFAAGTTPAGQSWFAIERIDGVKLTEFGADRRLSVEERLQIFLPVCDAIAYAHGRGVIHRDIKPSNILVERDGRARVLDFGLAKLLESAEDRSDLTITAAGRIHGTIPYMSPEQVRGGGGDVDVRSEVYSLGVVLYEWLCGGLPYAVDPRDLLAAARTIAESSPRPPRAANREISADLSTVILKALAKDPVRRYASVAAFADDLRRVLAREPISARPPTAAYQLQTLIRRHPVVAGLAALLVIATIGYAVGVTQALREANRNLQRAVAAESDALQKHEAASKSAERAARVTELLKSIFAAADPRRGGDPNVPARELLSRGADQVLKTVTSDDLLRAQMLHALGESHHHVAVLDKARSLLEEALALYEKLDGSHTTEISQISHELGLITNLLGDREASLAHYRRADAILGRRFDQDDFHSIMMRTGQLRAQGDYAALLPLVEQGLANLPHEPRFDRTRVSWLNLKAESLCEIERIPEAIETLRQAVLAVDAMNDAERGRDALRASIEGNLAWLLTLDGRLDEAERLANATLAYRRQTQAPTHIELSTTLFTLGTIQSQRNNCPAALPFFEEALQIRRANFDAGHDLVREVEQAIAECGGSTEAPGT